MKTKMSVLCLLFALLGACTNEIIENDTQVLLASAKVQLPKEKVTAENSFYEGDLYRFYLNGELEKTDKEIQALQDLIDEGKDDQDTQKQLDAAIVQRNFLKNKFNFIPEVYIDLKPPRPPCPKPRRCDFNFDFVLVPKGTKNLDIVILDSNGKESGGTNGTLSTLSQSNEAIAIKPFYSKLSGQVATIEVKFTDNKDHTREYVFAFDTN